MLHLIPNVKSLQVHEGFLATKAICYKDLNCDKRILEALRTLPVCDAGAKLDIVVDGGDGEGYTLAITEEEIKICARSSAGAFYAVQTLRQLFTHEKVPCLTIEDAPDFAYRGFYHDVTRGKVPTLETLKGLVDQMAYFKLNSLQLYVEHTFPFEECKELNGKCGYLTKDELLELGEYCRKHFIDFIPSLSTFGHMYEILNQPQYRHLRALKDYEESVHLWRDRLAHHTIDPKEEESFDLVKSLIDQYSPCFESEWFNICCDETFDLRHCADTPEQVPELYTGFVNKVADYVRGKGKKVMMWADFLWQWNHPEAVEKLPEDVCFLNWWYTTEQTEENFAHIARNGRMQIVCPGNGTWNYFCEDVNEEEGNICQLAGYAQKYNAMGILNTSWGDCGNPCSLELGLYGMVLGAEKSWTVTTQVDEAFYNSVDHLLYENENGMRCLKALSDLNRKLNWKWFCDRYVDYRYQTSYVDHDPRDDRAAIKQECMAFINGLKEQRWSNDEYRQEMILAAEAVCLMAQMDEKMYGEEGEKVVDAYAWIKSYSEKWLQKNKPSELNRITELFAYLAEN